MEQEKSLEIDAGKGSRAPLQEPLLGLLSLGPSLSPTQALLGK